MSGSRAYHNTIHGFDVSDMPKGGLLSHDVVFEGNFSYDNGIAGFSINSDSHHVVYSHNVAYEIATQENAYITALHIYSKTTEADDIEDELNFLSEIVVDELGLIPACLIPRILRAEQVTLGVLQETKRQPNDLLMMGASDEYGSGTRLFGSVDHWIIQHIEHCSVLLIRHHELTPAHWLRRQFKMMEKS